MCEHRFERKARTRRSERALAAVAALLLAAAASSGAEKSVDVAFDDGGLSAIRYAGAELLKDGRPGAASVILETSKLDKDGYRVYEFEKVQAAPRKTDFDRDKKRLRQQYAWGTIDFTYAPAADRLGVAVTITNTSDRTVAGFDLAMLTLRFPAAPEKIAGKGAIYSTLDNLAIVEAAYGSEKLLVCCETIYPPLHFGLGRSADKDRREYPVQVGGEVHAPEPGAYRVHPHGLPRVAPGKSQTLDFSLRFAPAEADNDKILGDLYRKFREHYSPQHVWKDHRCIGALNLPTGAGKSKVNPRGWFKKPEMDVGSPEGKAEFKKLLMQWADLSVKTLTGMDAQGMIVWNVEGEENPHPISYIGDPRMLKTLAPEMDELADEFFQKFRDAGVRTGVCIRPTQVYFDESKKKWAHGTGSDMAGRNPQFESLRPKDLPDWQFFPIVERICDKIAYARKRWGCTIFYIDTNGVWRPVGEGPEWKWFLLNANMWKRIKDKHPDVLLIPELYRGDGSHHAAQWAYCAEYLELDYGGMWTTPRHVVKLLPDAFSVINMKDAGNYVGRRADLVAGVRRGDILLFRGWFGCSVNPKVQSIYADAHKSQ